MRRLLLGQPLQQQGGIIRAQLDAEYFSECGQHLSGRQLPGLSPHPGLDFVEFPVIQDVCMVRADLLYESPCAERGMRA